MDSTTSITGLHPEDVGNLQRSHSVENGRGGRRPPARDSKRRKRKGRQAEDVSPPPTYTPDGQVADDTLSHTIDVSA